MSSVESGTGMSLGNAFSIPVMKEKRSNLVSEAVFLYRRGLGGERLRDVTIA